MFLIRIYKIKR